MSIAIIIGTHGGAAEQLLKTAEMILGKQENVSYIDFVPGENADTLVDKYNERISQLDTSDGVLFLVDMWGGSPFNAANRIVNDNEKYDVITGVNIPMLLDLFMARDDSPSMQELVATAIESGKAGIKAYRTKVAEDVAPAAPPVSTPTAAIPKTNKEGNLVIALARIDDRLIHGQVATRWTKETNVKRIVVVNDDVAKDEVRSVLLKQAAPPGITSHVISVEKMIRVYNNPEYANERMLFLFTNPSDVVTLAEKGIPFTSINVGGMAFKQGKKQVSDAVCVDDKDIAAFKELDKKGIEIEFRKVASDNRVNVMDLLKNL